MPRISTYATDSNINPTDRVIGSDGGSSDATKNYLVSEFGNYVNNNPPFSVAGFDFTFNLRSTNGAATSLGSLSVNNSSYDSVTQIKVNKTDRFGFTVYPFITLALNSGDILSLRESDQTDASAGGVYTVDSVVDSTEEVVITVSGASGTGTVDATSVVSMRTQRINADKIDLTDLSVSTASPGSAALSYSNTTGVFTYTPPDLSSFLTAEVNDLTAAVTWDDVPDVNITESSVTQHEAALTITESQISDLQSYLTSVDISDINATGTADATTFLRGDGSWQVVNSGGIALTDLSVSTASPGTAALTYDNVTGVFTYTPPNLSSFLTSSDLTGYVTIDTFQTISAAKTFSNVVNFGSNINVDGILSLTGVGTAGPMIFFSKDNARSGFSAFVGENALWLSANGDLNIQREGTSKGGVEIILGAGATKRTHTLQDKNGTIAHLADIKGSMAPIVRTLTTTTNTLLTSPPASVTVNTRIVGDMVYFEVEFDGGNFAVGVTTGTEYIFEANFTLPQATYEPRGTYAPCSVRPINGSGVLTTDELSNFSDLSIVVSGQGEADTTVYIKVRMTFTTLVSSGETFTISGNYQI